MIVTELQATRNEKGAAGRYSKNSMKAGTSISTEIVDACPLCGSLDKQVLYAGLRDRMYGVSGEWIYMKCRACGLVFLDPRPTEESIGEAYAVYPTHAPVQPPDNLLRQLRSYVTAGYLANKFGYVEGADALQRMAGWLMYLHPGQREYVNGSVMYLPADRRGHILDVGAGAGELLAKLRNLGWTVEGVDTDPKAAESILAHYGIEVRVGTLAQQGYPSEYFDALTMSHVIEHVHDPVDLLTECRRILKPGGTLVIATPNANSLGHHYFGRNWRAVEPPRHLTLFTSRTLANAARRAGFLHADSRSTVRGADGNLLESRRLQAMVNTPIGTSSFSLKEKALGHLYQYSLSAALRFRHDVGEELLMFAIK